MKVEKASTVMDVYARVSDKGGREGESYITVETQVEACRAAAARLGLTVGKVVVDEDVSGAKRPEERALEELLGRAERHETGGIIVAFTDRLSRGSLKETAEVFDRLDRAGARLIVANEGIDSASSPSVRPPCSPRRWSPAPEPSRARSE